MKQTVDYEILATASPINAQAARDFGAKGETEGAKADQVELLEAVRTLTMCPQPQFSDLTGLVKGRLTVLGRCKTKGGNGGSRWLVRCSCGRYEVRGRKALKPECDNDRCEQCRDLDQIKKGLKPLPEMKKGSTTA